MSLSERQRLIAEAIDRDCDRLILSGSTEIECLGQMHDHMPAFKELLDAGATQEAADRYPGFHRFAKILEQVAIGIQSGAISVPKWVRYAAIPTAPGCPTNERLTGGHCFVQQFP